MTTEPIRNHSSRAGNGLRHTARQLAAAAGLANSGQGRAQVMLIVRLTALAAAIADLRDAQNHAAQAAAARTAAQHLYAPVPIVSRRPRELRRDARRRGWQASTFPSRQVHLGRRACLRQASRPTQASVPRAVLDSSGLAAPLGNCPVILA